MTHLTGDDVRKATRIADTAGHDYSPNLYYRDVADHLNRLHDERSRKHCGRMLKYTGTAGTIASMIAMWTPDDFVSGIAVLGVIGFAAVGSIGWAMQDA